mgnify:CR=1 FL=1
MDNQQFFNKIGKIGMILNFIGLVIYYILIG